MLSERSATNFPQCALAGALGNSPRRHRARKPSRISTQVRTLHVIGGESFYF
jgi:hypothetical protein